ncbi:Uncharacterised protein [Mycobacterium tuberculosis]|nr:Uncharacterised protein [Mycobacterium tuberculosis]
MTKYKNIQYFSYFNKVIDICITIVCQFAKSQDTFNTSSRDCNVSLSRINCQYFSTNNITSLNLTNAI